MTSWSFAELPQIYANFQNGSSEAMSYGFILSWIAGDVMSVYGLHLIGATTLQMGVAVMYLSVTLILFFQHIWYNELKGRWLRRQAAKAAGADGVAATASDLEAPLLAAPSIPARKAAAAAAADDEQLAPASFSDQWAPRKGGSAEPSPPAPWGAAQPGLLAMAMAEQGAAGQTPVAVPSQDSAGRPTAPALQVVVGSWDPRSLGGRRGGLTSPMHGEGWESGVVETPGGAPWVADEDWSPEGTPRIRVGPGRSVPLPHDGSLSRGRPPLPPSAAAMAGSLRHSRGVGLDASHPPAGTSPARVTVLMRQESVRKLPAVFQVDAESVDRIREAVMQGRAAEAPPTPAAPAEPHGIPMARAAAVEVEVRVGGKGTCAAANPAVCTVGGWCLCCGENPRTLCSICRDPTSLRHPQAHVSARSFSLRSFRMPSSLPTVRFTMRHAPGDSSHPSRPSTQGGPSSHPPTVPEEGSGAQETRSHEGDGTGRGGGGAGRGGARKGRGGGPGPVVGSEGATVLGVLGVAGVACVGLVAVGAGGASGAPSRRLAAAGLSQWMSREALGELMGWIMTCIYLSSRVPQILRNIQRGTVEGLSLGMFSLAIVGNATYAAQILVRDSSWDAIRHNLPWITDCFVCLALDFVILGQFLVYALEKPSDGAKGAAEEVRLRVGDSWARCATREAGRGAARCSTVQRDVYAGTPPAGIRRGAQWHCPHAHHTPHVPGGVARGWRRQRRAARGSGRARGGWARARGAVAGSRRAGDRPWRRHPRRPPPALEFPRLNAPVWISGLVAMGRGRRWRPGRQQLPPQQHGVLAFLSRPD